MMTRIATTAAAAAASVPRNRRSRPRKGSGSNSLAPCERYSKTSAAEANVAAQETRRATGVLSNFRIRDIGESVIRCSTARIPPLMRWSKYFLYTLREVPADADVISQKLMMRAGMIRKVAAGIYTYLPLGVRSLRKLEAIVRDEMNRAGAGEVTMPTIQPGELWMQSGRWQKYGKELLRVKDRHDRDFVYAPPAEEVITET